RGMTAAQDGPRRSTRDLPIDEVDEAGFLIGEPELAGTRFDDSVHDSGPPERERRELFTIEDGGSTERRHDNSAGAVFECRPDAIVRETVACSIGRGVS